MAKKMCTHIVRRDGVDQISTLPDDVLVRILSLVPTEQAVSTSLLSKRWKFLWTLIPVLDFDYARFSQIFNAPSLDDQKRRFLEFVEHVFFHHELEPLEKLRLAFDITEFDDYVSKASRLVRFAMRSNCLTIDLDFSSQNSLTIFPEYDKMHTLPPCFFPHRSVSQLNLTSCKLIPSLYRSFTSVKVAKLTSVELQKDSVYDLVSRCPCLEELHLINFKIPSSVLELNAPESNLKCLVLKSCFLFSFEHASINIPTLLQLKFEGIFTSGYLSIHNSENLIEAAIKIHYGPDDEYEMLCKLLKDLQNVKALTIFSGELEVLNINGGISLGTPFNNLKHLTVRLGKVHEEVSGLVCLLRSSPNLETLSIDLHPANVTRDEISSAFYNVDEEAVQQLHLLTYECAHLMKLEIQNFQGLKVEMEFVKLILQSSSCLKEMVICIHSRYQDLRLTTRKEYSKTLKKQKAETIERLLAYKRASPNAQILLK
ncbi:hypothetical protein MKX03_019209 [Papaver bracteatum]|nr:hypothetical protein MKX03_019209 [Papaver bracteatum]